MKHRSCTVEKDPDSGSASLADFPAKRHEQSLNVFPWYVGSFRACFNFLQRGSVFSIHQDMVA